MENSRAKEDWCGKAGGGRGWDGVEEGDMGWVCR